MRRLAIGLTFVLAAAACGGGTSSTPDGSFPDSTVESSSATSADGSTTTAPRPVPRTDRPPAPEFPEGLEWLNTDRPLALSQLTGKIVVLDFWTYGCINCIHVVPELKQLEAEYPDELVVIGVHSAKFEHEAATENIRQIVLRYGVDHPVVNDANFEIWRSYGANAWPTIFAIDPAGGVVGFHAGEGVYDILKPVMEGLIEEFGESIDRSPLGLKLEREGLPETVLSFPGKVTADDNRLFISDTNHHRIIQTDLDGNVEAVYGTGELGFADGSAEVATFNQPQGTVVSGDGALLYVADTENHAVRAIDLSDGSVETVAGTGRKGWPPTFGEATSTDLNSPWAVERGPGGLVFIAMAGTHQIWALDPVAGTVGPYAGSAREGVRNGPAVTAELAQPSGVSLAADGRLFFTDSESSAIRWVDTTAPELTVGIAAGSDVDLFTFGDQDGVGTESLLQHPLGVEAVGSLVYLADTYNSKIKQIDLATGEVSTLWGESGGWRDGEEPLFYEPGGIDHLGGVLYVADTNNHSIRTIDLETGVTSTLILRGLEAFLPDAGEAGYAGTVVEYPPGETVAGPGTVTLNVVLPRGYKVNPDAPSSFEWTSEGDVAVFSPTASGTVINPTLPVEVDVTFRAGTGSLSAEVSLVYCEEEAESICLIEQVLLVIPMTVTDSGSQGATGIRLDHVIELPDL